MKKFYALGLFSAGYLVGETVMGVRLRALRHNITLTQAFKNEFKPQKKKTPKPYRNHGLYL